MREIKFRAWLPNLNKMSHDVTLFANGWIESVTDDGGEWKHGPNDANIMQFTGIKDKKDKEFYEGDICVLSNDRKKGIYTIVWVDNGFKLEIIVTKTYSGSTWNEKVHVPIFPNSYEIIGNMYENPDLLKD